ncbi:MAG: RNA-binding S4 domain-containing protein [Brachybacterium sp.]|nr:RNA-binding S4 domain-containing protein [Brachybacterium sp.]
MRAAAGADGPQTVRLDVWLWSARLMPTRSAATAACRGGHVRRNGDPVKAAQKVVVGDELRVRSPGRERVVIITRILTTRVGAPIAREAYEDPRPVPPPQLAAAPPRRERGTGRPTKRERRQFDRLRGRDSTRGPESDPDAEH